MSAAKPALGLVAVPGRRQQTLQLAREIEARGYSGIYCPSFGDCLALCEAIALVTEHIEFGTSVAPIYFRQVADYAPTASFIHEVSGGRFRFGIGVSHQPVLTRRGLDSGKPLRDVQTFVEELRAVPQVGELPPIILAALRRKMIGLAGDIADGLVFANGARSHMAASLAGLPPAKKDDPGFFVGNMIPVCIADDVAVARAVHRKTLSRYALLSNYRNYWKEAGYVEEMTGVERCIAANDLSRVPECLTDRWLDDTTIAGPPARARAELEKWFAAGITTPILVPSSSTGGQLQAFEELFAAFG